MYNQLAWSYDWVSHTFFHGKWRSWQRAAIPLLAGIPGPRVLELGFGTGDLQADLARMGYQPVGVDLSAAMLRVAGRKARRQGRRLQMARARSQMLPFPAATFAGVVSTFPSEYILDPRTIAEIARVLAPGGRLVVVPGAALLPVDRPARLLEHFASLVYGRAYPRGQTVAARRAALLSGFRHAPAFGPLLPRLAAAGFRVTLHTGVNSRSVVLVVLAERVGSRQ